MLIRVVSSFPNNRCHPDPVKLYLVKKVEYIEQMNRLYKTPSVPQVSTEVEPSTMSTQIPIDPLPSTSNSVTSLRPPSPFSFSPRLHCILGRSRYVPTEDEDPKNKGIPEERENYRSNSMATPLAISISQTVNNPIHSDPGIMVDNDPERSGDDEDGNQAPSSLEYSDGEKGKANEMVISEEDEEEEVDELDSSEYEGLSMVGMMVNTDSGGYYEEDAEDVVMAYDNAPTDMDDGMSEADKDDGMPTHSEGDIPEDEIPAELDVDGETWLFSQSALSELRARLQDARARGEEMDDGWSESAQEEQSETISTVIVNVAPVAGPSQPRRGRTGGNSK
jgi:hypothetical protein